MLLSKKTIDLIKYFSTINSNLLFQPGNELKTITAAKHIVATATITETIPSEFGIFNTNEFLGALSLFKEPDITFSEKSMTIKDAANLGISLKYVAASKDVICYPKKDVKMPAADVSFELPADALANIEKSASVIGVPDIEIVGSGEGIQIVVCDRKNPSANDFRLNITNVATPEDFTFVIKVENLKLLGGNHTVDIASAGLARFINKDAQCTTYIALEAK